MYIYIYICITVRSNRGGARYCTHISAFVAKSCPAKLVIVRQCDLKALTCNCATSCRRWWWCKCGFFLVLATCMSFFLIPARHGAGFRMIRLISSQCFKSYTVLDSASFLARLFKQNAQRQRLALRLVDLRPSLPTPFHWIVNCKQCMQPAVCRRMQRKISGGRKRTTWP